MKDDLRPYRLALAYVLANSLSCFPQIEAGKKKPLFKLTIKIGFALYFSMIRSVFKMLE